MFLDNKNIVLLATGSFNPPTNMHLRMFGKVYYNCYYVFLKLQTHFVVLIRNCSRSLKSFGVQHLRGIDITYT